MSEIKTFFPVYDPLARFFSIGSEVALLENNTQGTLTAGNRNINLLTEVYNNIVGAAIIDYNFRVPPGVYDIIGMVACFRSDRFRAEVWSARNTEQLAVGPCFNTANGFSYVSSSRAFARITVKSTDELILKVQTDGTYTGTDFWCAKLHVRKVANI